MSLAAQIKDLCQFYNIKPARSKGQNFLIKESVYNKIIQEAELKDTDTVLEVGPGVGILTFKMAQKAKYVKAVEMDKDISQLLQERIDFYNQENIEVINKDILKCDREDLALSSRASYKIVANLPYNITSRFLRKFLSQKNLKPRSMVLLLQKEVAQRIVARPPHMSLLSLSVQYFSDPKIVEKVPADHFWPRPRVDSAIVKFNIEKDPVFDPEREKRFFDFLKKGFSSKRKMLKNNLKNNFKIKEDIVENGLNHMGLNINIRAQELSLESWKGLFGYMEGTCYNGNNYGEKSDD